MKKNLSLSLISLLAFSLPLIAQDSSLDSLPHIPPPLPVVEKQLEKIEREFKEAKKMFNPWYAGPLLTPSAYNVPPGHFNVQPYLFVTNTYAQFDKNGKSRSIPDILTVNPVFIYQMGWVKWLDFTVILSALYNSQSGRDSFYIADTTFQWGFQILNEAPYRPALRFVISEIFPTGRYNKLNPKKNGIDATGAGSYQTSLSFNLSKVIWWIPSHPLRFRLSLNYTLPTLTHVKDFNAYGGGLGTRGRVRPGNAIEIDGSMEWSFTKMWVFALDLVYIYNNSAHFSGNPGRASDGTKNVVGAPSNDQFSLAPAIQYNRSENFGILAGVWFTLAGRNASNFFSGIVTLTYYW